MDSPQLQPIFQAEADGVVALYDNFLNEFTKQFRVKAVEEFRPTFQKVY